LRMTTSVLPRCLASSLKACSFSIMRGGSPCEQWYPTFYAK
jgi:hypothetical protein